MKLAQQIYKDTIESIDSGKISKELYKGIISKIKESAGRELFKVSVDVSKSEERHVEEVIQLLKNDGFTVKESHYHDNHSLSHFLHIGWDFRGPENEVTN